MADKGFLKSQATKTENTAAMQNVAKSSVKNICRLRKNILVFDRNVKPCEALFVPLFGTP
jgi:hypothetical protein